MPKPYHYTHIMSTIKSELFKAKKILKARGISSYDLDAEVLLSEILERPREYLISHDDAKLGASQLRRYLGFIARRAKFEPVAYIIGRKYFFNLPFKVSSGSLIPRPETELLVEEVLKRVRQSGEKSPKIIDIGTGSGSIALSLAKNLPKAKIWALEASADALKLAKFNAKALRLSIQAEKSDLLSAMSTAEIKDAILVANLPYLDRTIAKSYPLEIRRGLKYEPSSALYAGKHGTAVYEKLFKQIARMKVRPQYLIIEIDSHYWRDFLKLAKKYFPSCKVVEKKDYAGKYRMITIDLK